MRRRTLDRTLLGSSDLLRSVVSDRPRALLDVEAPNPIAVPLRLKSGLVSRGVDPLQSRHVSPAARRCHAGSGSREVSCPFDDITQASPMCSGDIHPRRGAALRLSQPPSGLPAHPSFAALFHAADRPWGSPFRALLLARIARPSRGRSAPLRFSVAVPEVRCSWPRPPGFTRLATPARGSPGLPLELARRFRQAEACLPRRAGPRSPGPPRSCGFGRFEAFLPARVRAPERRLPDDHEPLLSWAFAPPELRADLSLGPSFTQRTVPFAAELAPRRREGLPLVDR